MRRLARFGTDDFVDVDACFEGALARLSRRFFNVTDSNDPLKTCAWSLLTASCADAELVNSTWAEKRSELCMKDDKEIVLYLYLNRHLRYRPWPAIRPFPHPHTYESFSKESWSQWKMEDQIL